MSRISWSTRSRRCTRSTPHRSRCGPPSPRGFDEALWDRLLELGVVAMAVDEALGGWGASPLELALVAEQHGRDVAPAPLIEAQVAARLLGSARRAPQPRARAVRRAARHRGAAPAGRRTGAGRARRAPSPTTRVVLDRRRAAAPPPRGDARQLREPRVDAAGRRRRSADGAVLASGEQGRAAFEAALDDWLLLTGGRARRPRCPIARDRRRLREGAHGLRRAHRVASRPSRTAWPTRPPPSTAPACSPTRRRGRSTTTLVVPPSWLPWRSRSPPRPPATPPTAASTSTAATAS